MMMMTSEQTRKSLTEIGLTVLRQYKAHMLINFHLFYFCLLNF